MKTLRGAVLQFASQPQAKALHVVQISRDTALLKDGDGSEPIDRQLGYARELHRRAPGSQVTVVALGARAIDEEWRRDNLRVIPAAGRLYGALRTVSILRRLHSESPVDVITTQVPNDEAWLVLAAAYRHGIPVIGQVHSDLFVMHEASARARKLKDVLRHWLTRRTCRAFHAIRTVSSEARFSIARLAPKVPLATIPVPMTMVRPRGSKPATVRSTPLVIYVGRLAPEKDLGSWLQVAARVSREHPDAQFEIVGDGPERAELEETVARLGLRDRVVFRGFVPNADLSSVYERATAVLLTSRSEGFGRVLVEAASHGVPAVATSLAGPRDIIVHGVTGFLHEPGDIDAIARSVSTLVAQPARAASIGTSARAFARVRFDPDRLRADWIDLWVATATRRRRLA